MLMFVLWLSVYAVELLITFRPLWLLRRFINPLLIIAVLVSTAVLLPALTLPSQIVISVVALYRITNLLRISKGRMHMYYLQHVVRRTSIVIGTAHIFLFVSLSLLLSYITWYSVFISLMTVVLLVTVGLLFSAIRNVQQLSYYEPNVFLSDRDLPTVTVAIPARNETVDLEQCLKAVLRSNYPKLEVIVLDDCSHAKTSEVIKSFAHDGVRFINGEPPQKRWLAKNQAYQALLTQATGELVMFMGVDVRVRDHTIRNLVNTMYARRKRMLSVLPLRTSLTLKAVFIQPLRYWWELVPPRRIFNRPPVLSSCWIIDKNFLESHGGFNAVSHAILPETYFARKAVRNDEYTFLRSTHELGLTTIKSLTGQKDTAIRVKYPQIRRRLENVMLLTSIEILFLILPLIAVIYGASTSSMVVIFGILIYLALIATHATVLTATDPGNVIRGLVTFPVALASDVALHLVSMYKYEFGSVVWKGRNVCVPVMHVYPKLPAIKD